MQGRGERNERKGVLIGSKLIPVFCARSRAENNGKWGKIELGWKRKKGASFPVQHLSLFLPLSLCCLSLDQGVDPNTQRSTTTKLRTHSVIIWPFIMLVDSHVSGVTLCSRESQQENSKFPWWGILFQINVTVKSCVFDDSKALLKKTASRERSEL